MSVKREVKQWLVFVYCDVLLRRMYGETWKEIGVMSIRTLIGTKQVIMLVVWSAAIILADKMALSNGACLIVALGVFGAFIANGLSALGYNVACGLTGKLPE